MLVYPRLPVPTAAKRDSAPRMSKSKAGKGGSMKKVIVIVVVAVLGGAAAGFFARPSLMTDPEVTKLRDQLADTEQKQAASKTRADEAETERDAQTKAKQDVEAKLKQAQVAEKTLSDKASEADKHKSDLDAIQKKLRGVVDRSISTVSLDGDDVHIAIVDRALFKGPDEALSDGGKRILDKLAGVLKDMSDKQVGVQGHTDEIPPAPKAAALAAPVVKGKSGAKPAPAAAPTAAKPMTSWELSGARALAVVHYLQDTSKIEPTRLTAVAVGPYRPLSKTNKAANRRIELVLSAKRPKS